MANTVNVKMLQRSDSNENWESLNPVLGVGEIGFSTTDNKFKIGDGSRSWNELDYSNKSKIETYFEVEPEDGETDTEAIARATAGETVEVDDMAIVVKEIASGKSSRSAYVYSGEDNGWVALDGSYDINTVICDSDFILTEKIGTIQTLTDGSATLEAKGKTLKQVLSSLFAKEAYPTATAPKATITLAQAGSKEVGTVLTPSYTTSFTTGKYTYGPVSAITAGTYTVSNGTDTLSTSSGSFDAITVGDSTNYKLSLSVSYDADTVVPLTNIGNEYPSVAIGEGTATATSSSITGYRSFFYGVVADATTIDSALIRGLTNGGAYNGAKTLTVKAADFEGTPKAIIVAYPASSTRGGLSEVLLTSTMNLEIKATYIQQANVKVEGLNGYEAVEYKVYLYCPDAMGLDEVHQIKLA